MIKNRLMIGIIILMGCSDNQTDNVDRYDRVFDENKIHFKIKDADTSLDMSICYSVYVSDTNWTEMARYADSLISDKGAWSSVAFFDDSLKTPNLDFCSFTLDYEPVGGYTLDEEDGKFKLYHEEEILVLAGGKTVPMSVINN